MAAEHSKTIINNIEELSAYAGSKYKMPNNIVRDHMLTAVAQALSGNEVSAHKINSVYNDNIAFYKEILNCSTIKHLHLSQGRLASDIAVRKALAVLLAAEASIKLRETIFKLIQNHFPDLYKAAKRQDMHPLKKLYSDIQYFLVSPQAYTDRSLYLYISLYRSSVPIDLEVLDIILQNIYSFELVSPMNLDFIEECKENKEHISRLKRNFINDTGQFAAINKLRQTNDPQIKYMFSLMENIFCINHLSIDSVLKEHFPPKPELLCLAAINAENSEKYTDSASLFYSFFLDAMLDEYNQAKNIYINSSDPDPMQNKTALLEKEKDHLQLQADKYKAKISDLQNLLNDNVLQRKNDLLAVKKKMHVSLVKKDQTIASLKMELEQEQKYRLELNKLRELMFDIDNGEKQMSNTTTKSLVETVKGKKIFIIGGAKQWRRRLRESTENIILLSGITSYFDLHILQNADCILFYTGYMTHAVYNRIMNYVRNNDIPFGYLKTTNMELVEQEILQVLQQCKVIPSDN